LLFARPTIPDDQGANAMGLVMEDGILRKTSKELGFFSPLTSWLVRWSRGGVYWLKNGCLAYLVARPIEVPTFTRVSMGF